MSFASDFVWGAAAASYQIEGAAFEDGKGLSVWDMMSRGKDRIYEQQTGAVACDHYHRCEEDAQLMGQIGLKAYRLSISWPRVLPEGTGAVNEKGLAFYDRLVDALLAAEVEPYITLFHWDYPYELFCRGGWLNRDSADWFADYTRVIVERLSDRVSNWMTLNEPQCFINLGHMSGVHAPGLKLNLEEVVRAAHHALLAHGKAVRVIRTHAKQPAQIGFAPVGLVHFPASDRPEDAEAARRAMFTMDGVDLWSNTWWMDPVFKGGYPEDGLKAVGKALGKVSDADTETIAAPVDFFGFNMYMGQATKMDPYGEPKKISPKDGCPMTTMDWEVTPEALYWGPKFFYERYRKPIVVTENGCALTDWVSEDGSVHDPQRIDYLARYLRAYRRAAAEGVDAKGYFVWSVMDNFEWARGFSKRFGIIHVDYQTQQRTLKDSAYWYRKVIETNGAALDDDGKESVQ